MQSSFLRSRQLFLGRGFSPFTRFHEIKKCVDFLHACPRSLSFRSCSPSFMMTFCVWFPRCCQLLITHHHYQDFIQKRETPFPVSHLISHLNAQSLQEERERPGYSLRHDGAQSRHACLERQAEVKYIFHSDCCQNSLLPSKWGRHSKGCFSEWRMAPWAGTTAGILRSCLNCIYLFISWNVIVTKGGLLPAVCTERRRIQNTKPS